MSSSFAPGEIDRGAFLQQCETCFAEFEQAMQEQAGRPAERPSRAVSSGEPPAPATSRGAAQPATSSSLWWPSGRDKITVSTVRVGGS